MCATLKTLSYLDCAAVAHLTLDPEQEQFAGSLDFVFSELRKSSHSDLEHPFSIVVRGEIVGFFVLREKAALPEWAPPDVITWHSLRIGDLYQGNGYGKKAFDLVARWICANRPHISRVMFAVNARNLGARSAFLKVGCRDTGATYCGPIGPQNILEYKIGPRL
ncbi:GNAT family N-acetyltransferase [Bradyrhizobium sp. ma5]|uniref:GNAT family N-acetyltransferase n=1 Tax=Bradyrhizobium sp. ma5 TaxID=3344828 RepID=UPI0035D3F04E